MATNLFFSFTLNLILWLWLLWQIKGLPGNIPLHYNIYFGIDALGEKQELLYLPLIGLVFGLADFLFGALGFEREKILGYFLAGTASLVQLILLLASFFIIFISK